MILIILIRHVNLGAFTKNLFFLRFLTNVEIYPDLRYFFVFRSRIFDKFTVL